MLSAALLLNSCHFDTKENYLKDFSNFIIDMETNYQTFTEEDVQWVNILIKNIIMVPFFRAIKIKKFHIKTNFHVHNKGN